MRKDDERRKTWFRAERLYREGDHWYVSTREGIPVGPYDTEAEARRDADLLTRILAEATTEIDALIAIREFRDRPKR